MARVSGFIIVFNRIPALIAAVEANSRSVPKKVADKIAAQARAVVPVRTGYLQSSIVSVSISAGKEAEVQANAPYAAFVEYGTYKMAARPFLAPSVDMFADEFALEIGAPVLGKRI